MADMTEPMDPDEAQARVDELGEHIEQTKRDLADVLDPDAKERFVDSGAVSDASEADRTDVGNTEDDQTIAP